MALDVVLDLPVDQAFLLLYGGLTDLRVGAAHWAAADKGRMLASAQPGTCRWDSRSPARLNPLGHSNCDPCCMLGGL